MKKLRTIKLRTEVKSRLVLLSAISFLPLSHAQNDIEDEDTFVLTPFEVSAEDSTGYRATSSLAGTRLRTDLSDIGSSVSVFTEQLMEDLGAVDNETLLSYGVGTEVGGARGNFVNAGTTGLENDNLSNPNNNTRVRGLTSADNTRNYFRTDVPWDSYTIDRVDIQRGANSVLFGLGSPAGIINATTSEAGFEDEGEVQVKFDQFNSKRLSMNVNKVLVDDVLAVRVALLSDDQNFRQKPAYETDKRFFGTLTYQPKLLNGEGMTGRLKANFETGSIESNRPRYIAPIDQISPYFFSEGETGFLGEYDDLARAVPNTVWGLGGQPIDNIDNADIVTRNNGLGVPVNPWIGQSFTGNSPFFVFDGSTSEPMIVERFVNSRGSYIFDATAFDEAGLPIDQALVNDGTASAGSFATPGQITSDVRGVMPFFIAGKAFAAADLPFQGFWKDSSFTDTTYFDFYNNLIDGNTKSELKDWETLELDFSSTYFDNKLGINISYYKQDYTGMANPLLGANFVPAITVDVGALDRTATAGNRLANPYAGRAYVTTEVNSGGRYDARDRESKRMQAFGAIDFSHKEGIFNRVLGKHDFVGVLQEREYIQNRSSFYPVGWGVDYLEERNGSLGEGNPDRLALNSRTIGDAVGWAQMYLGSSGPNLTGLSSAGNLTMPTGDLSIIGFDATPLAGFSAFDAAMDWNDPWEQGVTNQARNPDNYVGWGEIGSYRLYGANEGASAREYLTTTKALNTEIVDSKALVWNGKFWDGAIVGMYGWREDDAFESWLNHDYEDDGPDFDTSLTDDNNRSITTQSRNWSAKANLSALTGTRDLLPFQVHLLHAEGEVQTPDPSRIDVFGRTLANAQGSTEDTSIMLVGNEGKWSFRATKYETVVKNAVSSASLQRDKWRLQQVLQQGAFRAGLIETGAQNYQADWLDVTPQAQSLGYGTGEDTSGEQARYLREIVAPAWREFESRLWNDYPLAQSWYRSEFQPGDQAAPNIAFPDNATLVEDQVSEGWELELTANPTRNWNLAINASKTEAVRDGLPGEEFGGAIDLIISELRGDAGQIPMWWFGGPGIVNTLEPFIGEVIKARALNGASAPEIRKWKANVISNYHFSEGKFKGLNIGGTLRYEDSQVFGYIPSVDENGDVFVDIEGDAFSDDSRETVDLWFGYSLKLGSKEDIDWKIQLNLYNAFGDNELVPLHMNPDGSFGQMGIREGSSWALSNTFSF